MADVSTNTNAHVEFVEQVQYQEKAEPAVPVPFFGAVYPDTVDFPAVQFDGFASNVEPIPDAEEVTQPLAFYPDWLEPTPYLSGEFAQNVEPVADVTQPLVVYPDELPGMLITPDQFASVVEPVPPAPDLKYVVAPDWLDPIPYLEGYEASNVEPIPDVLPDYTTAIYPDMLLPEPPPHPPSVFYTDISTLRPGSEGGSRGWHQAGGRGWYSSEDVYSGEPHSIVQLVSVQTIPDNVYTTVILEPKLFGGGAYESDPWGMFEPSTNRLIVRHPGWYLIGFELQWTGNVTGQRDVRINAYNPNGSVNNVTVAIDTRNAVATTGSHGRTHQSANGHALVHVPGFQFELQVLQNSGGDLTLIAATLQLFRYARTTPQLPT